MKKLLVILFVGLTISSIYAQSAKEELKKIQTRYSSAKSYSFDVSMKVEGTQGVYENNLGHVLHGENLFYTELGGVVSLVSKEKSILVNTESRTIRFISKIQKKKDEKTDVVAFFNNIQLSNLGSFKVVNNGTLSRIVYDPKDKSLYKKYIITFNTTTHQLIQIEYFISNPSNYDGAQKITIYYKHEKLNSQSNSSRYSFDTYLSKKSGKIVLSEKYKDYHLILD